MSSLHKLAESFLAGFNHLSAADHIFLRAQNCTHIFAPASINPPPQSNADFAKHITQMKVLIKTFPVIAKEIHVNEEKRQVVIWATGTATFWDEVKDSDDDEWVYHGEYIFILDVDADGKIERILEFLDSLGTKRVWGLMARAKKVLEKKGVVGSEVV